MSKPRIAILGGGPAGIAAAYELRRTDSASVTVFEQGDTVGGNAGSFEVDGIRVDFGSHRLHSACDERILADIRSLLGEDLAFFERHGRIRLRGRWLHFPLKPVDLLLRLDKAFAVGIVRDMVSRALPGGADEGETFASVLKANLGPAICETFYFPYARKMWGEEPAVLSGIQARKRVSAGSFKKILKRLVNPPGKGGYYYMRRGYGQLTEVFAEHAQRIGAEVRLGWRVSAIRRSASDTGWVVEATNGDETSSMEVDFIWSTIPVSVVARLIDPGPPTEVVEATKAIRYRSMVLVYLTLGTDQFTTTDAHYFPETDVNFTRLSEPKNYFRLTDPPGRTVLCAEIPCNIGDPVWGMNDEELQALVVSDMATAGLPTADPVLGVLTRRLPQAYPIYDLGYEVPFGVLDDWIQALPGFLSYGRQGLFAHDNTHHAFFMAYSAVDCLTEDGQFDSEKWAEYREIFATHVVED